MDEEGKPKLDRILGLYANAKSYWQPIRDNETKYYKQYRSFLDSDTQKDYYRWRSRLFIPATARAVDGLLPDLLLTIFGPNPFFTVEPREMEDVERAKSMEGLLSYQFEQAGFFNKFNAFLKQMALYGVSFGKVYWKTVKKNTKRRRPKSIFGMRTGFFELREDTEVLFDGPIFEPLKNEDVLFSPFASSLEDTWIIQRSQRTLGYLKELEKQGIYKNISQLESLAGRTQEDVRQLTDRRAVAGLPAPFGKEEGDRKTVEILEFWDEGRSEITTIGGQGVILREKANPLYIDPFVRCTLWDLPFEILGIGICERVCDLQDMLNAEVNQRLDNRKLKQNLILKVQRGMNVNVRNLLTRPGAVWMMDSVDAVQPLQMPDIETSASFAEENLLKQEIEEVTGVTKYTTGAGTDSGKRTATEVSAVSRAGSKSFALLVKRIEEQALKPIIRKFYQLDELLMTDTKQVRILGANSPTFQPVPPDEIRGDYDFVPSASSQLINKDMKAQQMIQLLGIAKDDPSLNRQKVIKAIWELWGNKDYTELFNPVPMVPMANQATAGMTGGVPGNPLPPQSPMGLRPPAPQEMGAATGPMPMLPGGGMNG